MARQSELNVIRVVFEPAIRRFFHFYWRVTRGLTIGVRALVLDEQGRVFLVKHSYVAGWHMPGGGVEAGETLVAALGRELSEEANIALDAPPRLFAIYYNRRVARRDHVALYVVRSFRQVAPPQPNREIIAHGFFLTDALPDGTTKATRRRLAEVLAGRQVSELW
jgi:8-oxo-dGTP pyrophosphatase MutT (NUDIX family)